MQAKRPPCLDPNVWDEAKVAQFFGCTRQTIQRKARIGEIPGRKISRLWFFHKDVITGIQFLSGRKL